MKRGRGKSAPRPKVEEPEDFRDWMGRPKVVPPTGGKPKAYTRCTTFVGCIEDMFQLSKWQQRHAVLGVAHHPDILAAIQDTSPEAKADLDRLAEEAKKRSGAGDAARWGSYMHSVTEAADWGQDPIEVPMPWMSTGESEPLAYLPDLAAYLATTEVLTAVQIEQFCVEDPWKIGGTPDRVVTYQGKRYIADLKTGRLDPGSLKIAAQLAVYSRSKPYDIATGERLEAHEADRDRGIVIHLPAGTGTCTLYWVDLQAGWRAVQLARMVRESRSIPFRDLMTELAPVAVAPPLLEPVPVAPVVTPPVVDPAVPVPVAPPVASSQTQDLLASPAASQPQDTVAVFIQVAATPEAVRQVWRTFTSSWTETHTQQAKARIAHLEGTTHPQGVTA